MTISNSTSKAVQVTDASLSAYSFPFKVFKAAELAVSCVDSSTKMETQLTYQQDFTVNGLNSDSGGLVVLTASGQDIAGTGHNLVIRRDMDFAQHMDLRPHDVMPAETLERAFDILTMETQQLKEEIQRALLAPPDQDKAMSWNEIAGQFNQAGAAAHAAQAAALAAEASAKSAEISAGKLESGLGQGADMTAHNADQAAHAALFGTKIRRRLTGDTTYYLRADGNDSNDGLSAAAAFATLPRFLAELNRLDGAGFALTLDMGAGDFPGQFRIQGSFVGVKFLTIRGTGNTTTIGQFVITAEMTAAPDSRYVSGIPPVAVENIAFTAEIVMSGLCSATFRNVSFLNVTAFIINVFLGAIARFYGSLTFGGSGVTYACFYPTVRGHIELTGLTVNFADGLQFRAGYGFITAHSGAMVVIPSNLVTNGSPTGPKYRLESGSGIKTGVGGQIIPGTLPGTQDATSWLV